MQPCVFLEVGAGCLCTAGTMGSLPSLASLFMCPELWGEGNWIYSEWIYRTQSISALWTIVICSDCLSGSDLLHPGIGITRVTWAGRINLGTPPRLSLLKCSFPQQCCAVLPILSCVSRASSGPCAGASSSVPRAISSRLLTVFIHGLVSCLFISEYKAKGSSTLLLCI